MLHEISWYQNGTDHTNGKTGDRGQWISISNILGGKYLQYKILYSPEISVTGRIA